MQSSKKIDPENKNLLKKISNVILIVERYLSINDIENTLRNELSEALKQLKSAVNDVKLNKEKSSNEEIAETLKTIVATIEEKICENQASEINDLISDVRHALEIQVEHPEFNIPKECLSLEDIKFEKMDRICFRGDDRHPDEIFAKGFIPRSPSRLVISEAFQSNDGVVQFSSRFAAAACFPFKSNIADTWVYVFKADKGFNVQAHGYTALLNGGEWGAPMDEMKASQMFIQELITDKINPECIIAAVQIKRYPRDDYPSEFDPGDFYQNCGNYQIIGYQMNENCTASQDERIRAEKFIKKEIKANKQSKNLPIPSSGFQRNQLFSLKQEGSNDTSLDKDHKIGSQFKK